MLLICGMRLRGNGFGRGVGGVVAPPPKLTLAGVGDLQLAALSADRAGVGLLPCGGFSGSVAAKQLDKDFTVLGLGSSSAFTMVTGGAHITTSGGSSSGSALRARLGGGVGGFAGTFSAAANCWRELKISTRPLMLNCCGVVVVVVVGVGGSMWCGDLIALGDMGGLPNGLGICVGVGGVLGGAAAATTICLGDGDVGLGVGGAAGALVKSKIWLN